MRASRWHFGARRGVAKLDYARVAAAALAYLIAGQGDAVGLAIYDETVRQYVPSRIGQSHLRAVLAALANSGRRGRPRVPARLRRSVDLFSRRGVLILISDLYDDEEAVEAELRRAVRMGHEVALFHVLTRDELEFPFGRKSSSRISSPDAGCSPARRRPLPIATRSRSFSNGGTRAVPAIASTTRAS